MLVPHLHLCNRAGFRDNAAKSGKPGHNRDIGPKTGTVPAKLGHLATPLRTKRNVSKALKEVRARQTSSSIRVSSTA